MRDCFSRVSSPQLTRCLAPNHFSDSFLRRSFPASPGMPHCCRRQPLSAGCRTVVPYSTNRRFHSSRTLLHVAQDVQDVVCAIPLYRRAPDVGCASGNRSIRCTFDGLSLRIFCPYGLAKKTRGPCMDICTFDICLDT